MSGGAPAKITVGFIPLLDCACIVAALEQGFARGEGLELALVRETSWANIRDRLIIGHFDAAHLLGPMAVAATLGIGHLQVPVIAPFALGLGGNAITVSNALWQAMRKAGATLGGHPRLQGSALAQVIRARSQADARSARGEESPLTFGMVYPFSCHNYELRYWLAAVGIDPDRDVRLVVIPPPFLVDAMRAGQIDGFCVGEPWNSVAVAAGVGTIVTPTTAIWPHSPEKVLGCRASWAQENGPKLDALVRALYRAAVWCEDPANHADLAHMLAAPRYIGAPAELLHAALANALPLAPGAAPTMLTDFYVSARHHATFPWVSHAMWFHAQMIRWGQIQPAPAHAPAVRDTYRPDIYRRALAPLHVDVPAHDMKAERFFDDSVFEPAVDYDL
ncbi:MAG TPA: CmpA/NrtA family ABC transporter substrate-binding protein [Steroidobacteraceae bacterium]|nr:CmpA/NrtA family ABC transporter substrate-binding protein [Steroidobacteraceae bacterium]